MAQTFIVKGSNIDNPSANTIGNANFVRVHLIKLKKRKWEIWHEGKEFDQ